MRALRSNLTTGAEAGRRVGEMMSGPSAVRNDPTGPASRQRGAERHALSLSLSLSLSTYRRLELCLVEM